MRWLANENVPLASIRRLRAAGHDVAAIVEDMPGSADPDVLARAVGELLRSSAILNTRLGTFCDVVPLGT